jgi:hypothetical protein
VEPDLHDALSDLAQMFKPYAGDNVETAINRTPSLCICKNCEYMFPSMFLPMDLTQAAGQAIRGNFCARCGATENIVMAWDTLGDEMPAPFTCYVESVGPPVLALAKSAECKMSIHARAFGSRRDLNQLEQRLTGSKRIAVSILPDL